MKALNAKLVLLFMIFLLSGMLAFIAVNQVAAQEPEPRIDQLAFKFSHNSYFCDDTGYCPLMHHHPVLQIDYFGVWGIELDFSIKKKNNQPRLIIGHDGECSSTHEEWGKI